MKKRVKVKSNSKKTFFLAMGIVILILASAAIFTSFSNKLQSSNSLNSELGSYGPSYGIEGYSPTSPSSLSSPSSPSSRSSPSGPGGSISAPSMREGLCGNGKLDSGEECEIKICSASSDPSFGGYQTQPCITAADCPAGYGNYCINNDKCINCKCNPNPMNQQTFTNVCYNGDLGSYALNVYSKYVPANSLPALLLPQGFCIKKSFVYNHLIEYREDCNWNCRGSGTIITTINTGGGPYGDFPSIVYWTMFSKSDKTPCKTNPDLKNGFCLENFE